ncbi:MAG: FAD-dependent oxidoreductase [Saprospiraceae bacterium]|nr:MAG: FAD-dependent oxidoreductase [Saprospiraceae bacterium]
MIVPTYDYLIVGQGIAGTLLTHFLLKAGQTVMVVDQDAPAAASKVAAGIINPITGRRYLKSWRIDELLPFAEVTYQALEKQLDLHFFHPRRIIRAMFSPGEENDWLARTAQPGYENYIADQLELGAYQQHISPARAFGEILQGAQVELGKLVNHYRAYLEELNIYRETAFDYTQLIIEKDHVQYRDIRAKRVVFCEGIQVKQNPYFNYLPFQGAKGEVLIIKVPTVNFDKILKHKLFIVPLGNDHYWIGSTYDNHYQETGPTEAGKQRLLSKLQEMLKVPFEIVDHLAAIRPTVRDRRPFLGVHPKIDKLFLFNGLGTKGASLGPFWANKMMHFLLENQLLDPEVDIQRFYNFFD